MCSNSTPQETDSPEIAPWPDRQAGAMADGSLAKLAKTARRRAIVQLIGTDDPIVASTIIEGVIDLAVAAATEDPAFFDRTALMARYGKSRKWVERLPVKGLQLQGAWLYRREDVLAYESSCEVDPSAGPA